MQEQVSEAIRLAQFPIEQTALSQLEKGLKTVDGQNLLTNVVRGCNNLKLSDYNK